MLRQILRGAASTHTSATARQGLFPLNRVASYYASRPAMRPPPAFNGESAVFAESMYEAWKKDPASVEAQWQTYFSGFEFGAGSVESSLSRKARPSSAAAGAPPPRRPRASSCLR